MAAKKNNPLIGRWRITEMEQWDVEAIDMDEEGFVEFSPNGLGALHFCCVEAELDCEMANDKPRTDFSFEGSDEGDQVNGRGWARLEADGSLYGEIAFHQGERSWFKAVKKGGAKKARSS